MVSHALNAITKNSHTANTNLMLLHPFTLDVLPSVFAVLLVLFVAGPVLAADSGEDKPHCLNMIGLVQMIRNSQNKG